MTLTLSRIERRGRPAVRGHDRRLQHRPFTRLTFPFGSRGSAPMVSSGTARAPTQLRFAALAMLTEKLTDVTKIKNNTQLRHFFY